MLLLSHTLRERERESTTADLHKSDMAKWDDDIHVLSCNHVLRVYINLGANLESGHYLQHTIKFGGGKLSSLCLHEIIRAITSVSVCQCKFQKKKEGGVANPTFIFSASGDGAQFESRLNLDQIQKGVFLKSNTKIFPASGDSTQF